MKHPDLVDLVDDDIDHVAGANGVIGGPNGEGCTEPTLPEKPGTGFELPVLF